MAKASVNRKKKRSQKRVAQLRPRSAVPVADCWDLSSLFSSDEAWEKAFLRWQKQMTGYQEFQGKLAKSVKTLVGCLEFDSEVERAGERLAYYAHLKTAEDSTNSEYQRMMGRYLSVDREVEEAASFIRPELLAIPANRLKKISGCRDDAALAISGATTRALQTAYAGPPRRKATGHAG